MNQDDSAHKGPDLTQGVAIEALAGGKLLGHVGDRSVLLVKGESGVFAVDAECTHYHGPLQDGLVTGDSIRCPWHHACFDLRTGEATRAPALSPLGCWRVDHHDGRLSVDRELPASRSTRKPAADEPGKVVIVGGGGAGFAAAEMLRRQNFGGEITILSRDRDAPVDRPNLSKDYLAGSAPGEWIPLRSQEFYGESEIDLRLDTDVTSIDSKQRRVVVAGGETFSYDRLLLATGAEPVQLPVPGADQPHVHTLRSLADSRAIIAAIAGARRAAVIGASFIGLETAAALRTRGLEVHVVAPEQRPMERILGPEMGTFIQALHEEHGVIFHLGEMVSAIDGRRVILGGHGAIDADVVVIGVGVKPRLHLAEQAGLALDRGILVNRYLETSEPGIFAAGDIVRWPDVHSGGSIRVEHWVVALRQGQTAAGNMLGQKQAFDAVPFFWSQHYDVPINYVGHAEHWDRTTIEGRIEDRDCLIRYERNGRLLAVASIFRDLANLQAELMFEGQSSS